jgi:predicted 2-oxoglutarate/Fe(II)-dependent dioxygenase YbiX
MQIDEAIVILKIDLEEKFRKKLISFIDYKATSFMSIGGFQLEGEVDKSSRRVNGYSLDDRHVSDRIYFRHISNIIFTYLSNYKAKFPNDSSRKLNQIDLLKYKPEGKYDIHVDNDTLSHRTLSVIFNLNNEYEGGDLVFFHPVNNKEFKRFKLNTGSLVLFPSNFLFPHAIEPITKGVRYSLVSWIQ